MGSETHEPLDRMRRVDQVLDEYEGQIGLSKFQEQSAHNIEPYLQMTRERIEKLTSEDCAEIAVLLGSFSFYLQRCYNRELSRVHWAEDTLKSIIAGREQQYSGSWNSQYHQAIKEDAYANKMFKLKIYAQQRVDRITFLSTSIKHLCDLLTNLQRARNLK